MSRPFERLNPHTKVNTHQYVKGGTGGEMPCPEKESETSH